MEEIWILVPKKKGRLMVRWNGVKSLRVREWERAGVHCGRSSSHIHNVSHNLKCAWIYVHITQMWIT